MDNFVYLDEILGVGDEDENETLDIDIY